MGLKTARLLAEGAAANFYNRGSVVQNPGALNVRLDPEQSLNNESDRKKSFYTLRR